MSDYIFSSVTIVSDKILVDKSEFIALIVAILNSSEVDKNSDIFIRAREFYWRLQTKQEGNKDES